MMVAFRPKVVKLDEVIHSRIPVLITGWCNFVTPNACPGRDAPGGHHHPQPTKPPLRLNRSAELRIKPAGIMP